MPLAPRVRGRARKRIIRTHRLLKLLQAWEKYLNGDVRPEFVYERARKWVQVSRR